MRDSYRAGFDDRHAVPGMVVSIQTYGDLANWQPHVHEPVSAGLLDRQGEFTSLALPPAGVAESGGFVALLWRNARILCATGSTAGTVSPRVYWIG